MTHMRQTSETREAGAYGFRVVSRPVYVGDYEAILREIEIWPDRLTEGLPGWEEYGDQDVPAVLLCFEVLDGSPEALRPRAAYLGFWPYESSIRQTRKDSADFAYRPARAARRSLSGRGGEKRGHGTW